MADFARFRAVSGDSSQSQTDFPVTLESGPNETKSFTIDLPNLDRTRAAVLMFKVNGIDGSHLKMVNHPTPTTSQTVIDFKSDDTFTKPRSWHEIVQGNQFSETSNKLAMITADTPFPPNEKVPSPM